MSTLFPEPQPSDELAACQWCGLPSTARMAVTPALFTATGGVRRLKQHAIEVDVCAEHAAMIARNKAEAEAIAKAKAKAKAKPTRKR